MWRGKSIFLGSPRYQAHLDGLNGSGQQRILLPADGNLLPVDRLSGTQQAPYPPEGLRYEQHHGLCGESRHQFQEHQQIPVLWTGAIRGRLLRLHHPVGQRHHPFPNPLHPVSKQNIPEGIRAGTTS